VVKTALNIAPERRIPTFARRTFRQWFAQRDSHGDAEKPAVLLWPDTWNNYFLPVTAQSATAVLEAAGFRVTIPPRSLCCGRPLYDYGMLDLARKLLRQIVDTLRPQLRAGMSIVGLEPSCISVFRDELTNLLPGDEDAERLRNQSFMLGEFLARNAKEFSVPSLGRAAIVQAHCHHRSVLDFDSDQTMLGRAGVKATVLDSGCCGMAGAFGYEKGEHYRVSVTCGERVLLPAVRKADADTLIVADGFSCREQIEQTTNRRAVHLADVLAMGIGP
jgi:Fe-S oxidoreductase